MRGKRSLVKTTFRKVSIKFSTFLRRLSLTVWSGTLLAPFSQIKRAVAEHFHWMHTLDREKVARRLSEQRPENMPPLNVLIQINISDEASKSGITLAELPEVAEHIHALPNLRLRGLMTIPAVETDPQRQLAVFRQMTDAFNQLKKSYPQVDTLSMGMSDDMGAAIQAGSTLVRIGTAIFGARDYR